MTAARRILVVDDEPSLLLTLVANLELEGFETVEADSALHALELVERQAFDLVLSDVRMPGMDGVTMLHKIRERCPDLPVVLMTAFAFEHVIAEAVRSGVFTIVPKPFEISHLVAILAIAVRRPLVLVVDGDWAASTAEALRAAGLRARAASERDDALEIVRRGEADVCVVDLAPGEDRGAELIERAREVDPSVVCVAISGTELPSEIARVAAATHTLLRRPLAIEDLLAAIVEARRCKRA